jgi:hypothetical protein
LSMTTMSPGARMGARTCEVAPRSGTVFGGG